MNETDPARCWVNLIHADKSKSRCVLGADHTEQETDHMDEHDHRAPCLRVNQAIAAFRALHGEVTEGSGLTGRIVNALEEAAIADYDMDDGKVIEIYVSQIESVLARFLGEQSETTTGEQT